MTAPAYSGIAGEVVLSPILPVEWPGAVNERPYEAVVTIVDGTGRAVATVRSDAAGRFEVPLAPGTYRVSPEPEGMARAPEQAVAVAAGHVARVRIVYDSGMR